MTATTRCERPFEQIWQRAFPDYLSRRSGPFRESPRRPSRNRNSRHEARRKKARDRPSESMGRRWKCSKTPASLSSKATKEPKPLRHKAASAAAGPPAVGSVTLNSAAPVPKGLQQASKKVLELTTRDRRKNFSPLIPLSTTRHGL